MIVINIAINFNSMNLIVPPSDSLSFHTASDESWGNETRKIKCMQCSFFEQLTAGIVGYTTSSLLGGGSSLVPVLHHSYRRLQYELCIIRTASDDSCSGGLGTRLGERSYLMDLRQCLPRRGENKS